MKSLSLVNNVKLIGNVGSNPILETTSKGLMYLPFSIATNEGYKDKDGNRVEKTVWHNCVCYGKTAEVYFNLLNKGTHVALEGSLTYNTFEHEKGVKITSTSILVDSILLLSKKPIESIDVVDAQTVKA